MKILSSIIMSLLIGISAYSQSYIDYQSLDSNNPILFGGDYIIFDGEKILLGPHSFFIDGRFSAKETEEYNYIFNSVNEAAKHLSDGTEKEPMTLHIAPWVYWIDNPDDPAIRVPKSGGTPFGLEIDCEWLKFHGLTGDPKNVVLAVNRGQTMGAKGNFTMLNIVGNGTSAENVTFGNYCNIDLEFPLNTTLNREKRGSAIVQAQLVFCRGDRLFAGNCRFISRLNLCPFVGGKRTLFDRCHFECTDDALNGTAVYLNCSFDFYSGKPFWGTWGTGAVFLNCDINSFTRGQQYFTKSIGQVAVIDSRFTSKTISYLGWRDHPANESRNYQYGNQLNGTPIMIDAKNPFTTVDMTGKELLDAYRFVYKDKLYYNTYNLLQGDDDWDPMAIKEIVKAAEKENSEQYTNLATQLLINTSRSTIETGKDTLVLEATFKKFGNYSFEGEEISWSIASEADSLVDLSMNEDGTCRIIPSNKNDETEEVIVMASTPTGLEAASVIYVSPTVLESPEFISLPEIRSMNDGKLLVEYSLDMRFEDQSLISWYRCSDARGSNPIEVAVSRFNKPQFNYELSKGDIGYFIMAAVSAKHLRCLPGEPATAITAKPIIEEDVNSNNLVLYPKLESLSTKAQQTTKPGFWTFDCYKPADTYEYDWKVDSSKDPWYYGIGVNGAASDTGLIQASKGARLRYTPVGNTFGDMKISFTAVPAKTAGQGFSSAKAQYMDIFIKFDTEKLNGYALRLVRTTKYHNAIDFVLMKYTEGIATPISEPVSASCYRPDCQLSLEVKANKLIVHAVNENDYYSDPSHPEVLSEVNMENEIIPNQFGGFGFQHTGTVRSGATLIKDLKVEWR